MSEQPRVSIILTSYNHAKYLRESIESVLNQTFADFELIIWDDASIDESWAIIRSYPDSRIRAFRNETNQHGVSNVNRAILEQAKGKYIAIQHSDDIWEPQKLETQVRFLDDNPHIGAVFTRAHVIDENGEPFQDKSHFYSDVFDQPNRSRQEWLNYFFYHGNALCHPSVLIRKSCYETCGAYRYGLAQLPDFDMWVRLCLKYDIHVLPERLVRFRVRANASSADSPDARIRWHYEFLRVLDNYTRISSSEELTKVFPSAKQYVKADGIDVGFALAMIALKNTSLEPTQLFGISLLFDAVNEPARAKRIKDLYGFDLPEFLALSTKHDIFSVEAKARLAVAEARRCGG